MFNYVDSIPVDSGQLIAFGKGAVHHFKSNAFQDLRSPIHVPTGDKISEKYLWQWDTIIPEFNKSLNQLQKDEELKIVIKDFEPSFDYAGVCNVTLHFDKGIGLFKCTDDSHCVASSTFHGDGFYPVFKQLSDGKTSVLYLTGLPRNASINEKACQFELKDLNLNSNQMMALGVARFDNLSIIDPCYLNDPVLAHDFAFESNLSGTFKCTALIEDDRVFGLLIEEQ